MKGIDVCVCVRYYDHCSTRHGVVSDVNYSYTVFCDTKGRIKKNEPSAES